jgi:hypothetical protein
MTQKRDYEAVRQAAEATVDALWTRIGALLWRLVFALLVFVAIVLVVSFVRYAL